MSVSSELLCSFELLKPLDSNALKNHIKKGRNKRNHLLNSPVRPIPSFSPYPFVYPFTVSCSTPLPIRPPLSHSTNRVMPYACIYSPNVSC
jgi:hypothetical protein